MEIINFVLDEREELQTWVDTILQMINLPNPQGPIVDVIEPLGQTILDIQVILSTEWKIPENLSPDLQNLLDKYLEYRSSLVMLIERLRGNLISNFNI